MTGDDKTLEQPPSRATPAPDTTPDASTSAASWEASTVADLLTAIESCGLDVPAGIPEEIVVRGAETGPLLRTKLHDPTLWATGEGPQAWTPIHFMHLLGAIGDAAAVDDLIKVMRREELGDWLIEGMPMILAWLDPQAIDALERAARDETLDCYQRLAAATGIFGIGCRHPETRDDVASRLAALIREAYDPVLAAWLVDEAATVDDQSVRAAIDEAFEQGRVAEECVGQQDVMQIRRTQPPWSLGRHAVGPMQHFTEESLSPLRRAYRSTEPKRENKPSASPAPSPSPVPVGSPRVLRDNPKPKIGRNKPCPCGSGKKYKKCCGR